jgi:hypothetical protein
MSEVRNTLSGDFTHKVKELNRVTEILLGPKKAPSTNKIKFIGLGYVCSFPGLTITALYGLKTHLLKTM